MNLIVKIYMKIYDRHNKTLWTTDFLQLCVLSYILLIQKSSSLFYTKQSCDRLKSDTSAAQEKKKNHYGQVFQSLTSFETCNFFFFSLIEQNIFAVIFKE